MHLTRRGLALTLVLSGGIVLGAVADRASAAPAPPVRVHPRLFLDADTLDGLRAAAARPGSATAAAIAGCDDVIAHPGQWQSGGYQGLGFIEPLSDCLVAWAVRGDPADAQTAATYFRALLDDYETLGDGAGGDTAVQHDDGYPMRSFGPYAAIAYDWLHDAPGVDGDLLAHARARFKAWTDWYGAKGYHRSEAGANYHAGYVFAATMIAIAEAGEAGGDGDALWGHVVDDIFAGQLAPALAPGGVLDGGDWLEGWQYGPLVVAEYALSARALRGAGVPLAGYSAWEGQLMARTIFATVPDRSGGYVGGDSEGSTPYTPIDGGRPRRGAGRRRARRRQGVGGAGPRRRSCPRRRGLLPADRGARRGPGPGARGRSRPTPRPGTTPPARGRCTPAPTGRRRRCGWCRSARRAGSPTTCSIDAGNVVLTRGGDRPDRRSQPVRLAVDPDRQRADGGEPAAAAGVPAQPGLLGHRRHRRLPRGRGRRCRAWSRPVATTPASTASRTRTATSRARSATSSSIPYGQGDAVLVIVDDVDGAATDRPLDLRLRSTGTFSSGGAETRATVGGSDVVVQTAYATAGTAAVDTPPVGDCCSAPRGQCTAARFARQRVAPVGAARPAPRRSPWSTRSRRRPIPAPRPRRRAPAGARPSSTAAAATSR